MGNRAAVYFADYDKNGEEQPATGVYLHWNGGPESIYAFTKQLANYAKSQNPTSEDEPTRSSATQSVRFLQMLGNYFNGSSSDFSNVYLVPDAGSPKQNSIETEHGVYVIRPDFAIDRFDDEGNKFSDKDRIAEFAKVTQHSYWQQGENNIFEGIRDMNDKAFLKAYSREGEPAKTFEHREAQLPVEKELEALKVKTVDAQTQPTLAKVSSKAQRELEL